MRFDRPLHLPCGWLRDEHLFTFSECACLGFVRQLPLGMYSAGRTDETDVRNQVASQGYTRKEVSCNVPNGLPSQIMVLCCIRMTSRRTTVEACRTTMESPCAAEQQVRGFETTLTKRFAHVHI
jgi:hypothetical protein